MMFLFAIPGRLGLGIPQGTMQPGLLFGRKLPLWAVIYSLSIFWLVWSPTEEMTYNGYLLPWVQALTGCKWIAILVAELWWALRHSFLPFILDWRYVVWRFLFSLPGVVAITAMYLCIRRLPPTILAHWGMDLMAVLYTLKF
jgi:membrane protease YdiL (CAAX protease family)